MHKKNSRVDRNLQNLHNLADTQTAPKQKQKKKAHTKRRKHNTQPQQEEKLVTY
jgi:hypothetical protein